jgi:hypothetical protein
MLRDVMDCRRSPSVASDLSWSSPTPSANSARGTRRPPAAETAVDPRERTPSGLAARERGDRQR